jgi:IS5 family transposase
MTRKQVFLAQMQCVFPWAALVALITPVYPEGRSTVVRPLRWRRCFACTSCSSGAACQTRRWKRPPLTPPLYREFAQLGAHGRLPDESILLRFHHRLEKHKLADQILDTVNHLLRARGLLLKAGLDSCPVQAKFHPAKFTNFDAPRKWVI